MHLIAVVIVSVILGTIPLPTINKEQPPSIQPAMAENISVKTDTPKSDKKEEKQKQVDKPTVEKELTWQDNPQKCNQETHYIAAEKPFDCIEKPSAPSQTIANKEAAPAARAITGNKHDWLRASGIPESEWQYVDYIVGRESGWNPCAYNPGQSDCNANPTSACGLAQSLPCGKQSKYGHWTDPVANLKWQYEYVKGRYGGYAQAYAFWTANHWY